MRRIKTMSRFVEPNENDEPKFVVHCSNCEEPHYEGEEVVYYNNRYYCTETCLIESLADYEKIILGGK